MKLLENFGECEFHRGVFGAENVVLEFLETGLACGDVDVVGAGVEQPNVTKSDGEIFLDTLAQFSEAVGRRENFDQQEWRRRSKTDDYTRTRCGEDQFFVGFQVLQ